jgi:hypothetical protein
MAESTNEPAVETGDVDATRPDVVDLVAPTSEKPTNQGDAVDGSSASSEPLSVSVDDDLPAGDVDDHPIDKTAKKPVVKATKKTVVKTGDDDATRPETTNKPVVKTVDSDVTRPDEPVLVAASSEKPATNPAHRLNRFLSVSTTTYLQETNRRELKVFPVTPQRTSRKLKLWAKSQQLRAT